jgi:hypothetical protein
VQIGTSGNVYTGVSVADSRETWNLIALSPAAADKGMVALFWAVAIGGAANTVTATWTGGTAGALSSSIAIMEYSGIAVSSPVDGYNSAVGTVPGTDCGPVFALSGELMVVAAAAYAKPGMTWSPQALFVTREFQDAATLYVEDATVVSPSDGEYGITASVPWASVGASFTLLPPVYLYPVSSAATSSATAAVTYPSVALHPSAAAFSSATASEAIPGPVPLAPSSVSTSNAICTVTGGRFVQAGDSGSALPSGVSWNLPFFVERGNGVVCAIHVSGGHSVLGVAGVGGLWQRADGISASTPVGDLEWWCCIDAAGGAQSITVTTTGGLYTAYASEWLGPTAFSAAGTATSTDTNPSLTVTPAAANSVVLVAAAGLAPFLLGPGPIIAPLLTPNAISLSAATGAASWGQPLALSSAVATSIASATTRAASRIVPASVATSHSVNAVTAATVSGGGSAGIMWIIMENTDWSTVVGDSGYCGNLSRTYGTATNVRALGHYSAPNYLGYASGIDCYNTSSPDYDSTIVNDSADTNFAARTTIFDQLHAAGMKWRYYLESGTPSYHEPGSYFPRVTSLDAGSYGVAFSLGSYANITADLNSASPPRFMWLGLTNSDSGSNDLGGNSITTGGDTFLSSIIPVIQGTSWYAAGGQVLVFFDEGASGSVGDADGGPIGCIVVSLATYLAANYTTQIKAAAILGSTETALGLSKLGTAALSGAGTLGTLLTTGGGGSGAPVNNVAPLISGSTVEGNTLSTTPGTWTNSPTGYTYQWQSNGVNVGTGASTYPTVVGDETHTITVTVTAVNGSGSASKISNTFGPITAVTSIVPFSNGVSAPGPGANNHGGQPWTVKFNENWDGNDAVTGASYGATSYGNDNGTNLGAWANPHWAVLNGSSTNGNVSSNHVWVTSGFLNLLQTTGLGAWVSTGDSWGQSPAFNFIRGYFEARIYLPGSGASIYNWPAFWAVGNDSAAWPDGGEIDVAEGLGTVQPTFHYGTSSSPQQSNTAPGGTYSNAFHVYGANWYASGSSEVIDFYYDGVKVYTATGTIDTVGNGMSLICNVGDDVPYGGTPASNVTMQVDYVRLWQ